MHTVLQHCCLQYMLHPLQHWYHCFLQKIHPNVAMIPLSAATRDTTRTTLALFFFFFSATLAQYSVTVNVAWYQCFRWTAPYATPASVVIATRYNLCNTDSCNMSLLWSADATLWQAFSEGIKHLQLKDNPDCTNSQPCSAVCRLGQLAPTLLLYTHSHSPKN